MAETVELSLSSRPEFVGAVRHVFHALGMLAELSPENLEDLKLAVSEAVTNALTRQSGHDGDVKVIATREKDSLTVEVRDSGPPTDPAQLEESDPLGPDTSREFSFETGLSLPLIRGLVDEIDFEALPEGGLTVRFRIKGGADTD
jgi:serine/threonine-protein kinase RsbW